VLIIGCGSPTEEIGRSSSELLAAITKGDIDAVKEFLKNGTDANVKVRVQRKLRCILQLQRIGRKLSNFLFQMVQM